MDPIFILILIGSVILVVVLSYLDHVIWTWKIRGMRGKLTQFLKSSGLTEGITGNAATLIWELNGFFPWARKGAINNLVMDDSRGVETIFTALDLPYYKSWIREFVVTRDEFMDVFSNLIVGTYPVLVGALAAIGCSSIEKIKGGLQHPNLNVRLSVMEALGKTGIPEAAGLLIPILDSSNVDERISAVVALGKLRARSATEKVVNALKDEHPVVSERAVYSLVEINDHRAIPALELVCSDNTVIGRQNSQTLGELAQWAIGKIREKNLDG